MPAGRKKKSDTELVLALACGASAEAAARKTGVCVRTVYRRLQEPAFQQQVRQVRGEMVERSVGMLTAAGLAAVKTFSTLQESARSEAVRLGAARAVLELGGKLREGLELAERLAAVEAKLDGWLGLANSLPASAPEAGPRSTKAP